MTDTAVIVVSYNTRELTLQAVAAARKASLGLDARVLVADNGSTDGTAEAVRAADPEVAVLVNADNPGYGAAVNRAAAGLPSTHVCAMNADVVLEPESLLSTRTGRPSRRPSGSRRSGSPSARSSGSTAWCRATGGSGGSTTRTAISPATRSSTRSPAR